MAVKSKCFSFICYDYRHSLGKVVEVKISSQESHRMDFSIVSESGLKSEFPTKSKLVQLCRKVGKKVGFRHK